MISTQFNTLVLLALSAAAGLGLGASAAVLDPGHGHGLARRASGDVAQHRRLAKRTFSDSRWSFYDVGLGACGETNVASDYIVALNEEQFGSGYPGPYCFKQINLSYGGKTAVATITDMCPGCPYGGLDFSRGLFDHFADESVGIIYGEWSFVDGSDSGSGSTSAPTTTTKAAVVVPTTTSTKKAAAPTTTSTKKAAAPTTSTIQQQVWVEPTTSSTKKSVAPTTTTSSTKKAVMTTTTSSRSSSKAAPSSSSSSDKPQSLAAALSVSASLASSFSSVVLPSASASASASASSATGAASSNTTETNIELINSLLVRLGQLITTALEENGDTTSS